jgi:hypothetical protein
MHNLSDSRFGREDVGRYGIAILAAVLSVLLRQALSPLLGNNNPYHTAWASVIFVAWYCGAGPAILTVILRSGRCLVLVSATYPLVCAPRCKGWNRGDDRLSALFLLHYRARRSEPSLV